LVVAAPTTQTNNLFEFTYSCNWSQGTLQFCCDDVHLCH
jgi:hypothetical protein